MLIEESPATCGSSKGAFGNIHWKTIQDNVLECRVLLIPEQEGGYSAHCIRLPGVVSEGESLDEAVQNISEAFREAIRCYRGAGESIPWQQIELDRPKGCMERWILVNV